MGFFVIKLFSFMMLPLSISCICGCGSTLKRDATQQLLASDAVDSAVAEINFSDLAGEKVFFETRYVKHIKGLGFVNAEYIISSMRQQMIAADLHLQETSKEADYIVEARVGALGTNSHEIIYGVPPSSTVNTALNTAASMVPAIPAVPAIPEIAFAKKNDLMGAAKIGAFAYHRETGRPVWQSGVATSRSTAKDTWIFGAGPFQNGTIYNEAEFAGSKYNWSLWGSSKKKKKRHPDVEYNKEHHFKKDLDNKIEKQAKVSTEKTAPSQKETAGKSKQSSPEKPFPWADDLPKSAPTKNNPLHIKWSDAALK